MNAEINHFDVMSDDIFGKMPESPIIISINLSRSLSIIFVNRSYIRLECMYYCPHEDRG